MAPLILGFVAGTIILWTIWWWRRRPKGRMVECCVCGDTIPVAKATIIHGTITQEREGFATTVAEYCRRHAPGQPRSLP